MNRYLITGGSGFIGTNLVEFHRKNGDEVLNLDTSPPRCKDHAAVWKRGSILASSDLREVFANFRPTHVYHLAARTDLDGRVVDDYEENTRGVRALIEVCQTQPQLRRVLFASSRLVCRIGYEPSSYSDYCPSTAYGASKVIGEKIVASIGNSAWTWSVFRPTSIWGPWFGVPYRNFFDAVRMRRYLHPAGANIHKSFGYVGNAVYQISRLMEANVHGGTYYVGDYEPIEVFEFSKLIARNFGVREPLQVPTAVLVVAAFAGDAIERVGIRAALTSFRLKNLRTPMVHDFSDLKEVVGSTPYSLEQAVAETTNWIRENE